MKYKTNQISHLKQMHVKVRASCPRGPWTAPWPAQWGSPLTWLLRRSPSCPSSGASKAPTSSPPTPPTSSGTATAAGSRWTEPLGPWSSGSWRWRTAGRTTSPSYRTGRCRRRGASRWLCTVSVSDPVAFRAFACPYLETHPSVWGMRLHFATIRCCHF